MNKTSILPRKIRNRMYEYQNLWRKSPLIVDRIVCNSNISPIASECFICVNTALDNILVMISVFVISESSLIVKC
jgi:hypothetical protein